MDTSLAIGGMAVSSIGAIVGGAAGGFAGGEIGAAVGAAAGAVLGSYVFYGAVEAVTFNGQSVSETVKGAWYNAAGVDYE